MRRDEGIGAPATAGQPEGASVLGTSEVLDATLTWSPGPSLAVARGGTLRDVGDYAESMGAASPGYLQLSSLPAWTAQPFVQCLTTSTALFASQR